MITVSRPLAQAALLQEYYATVGPLMERVFGLIPFAWATHSDDPNASRIFHGPLSPYARPKGGTVEVTTANGTWHYPRLSAENIEQMAAHGPIEIHSWSPSPRNPERAAYARILIERSPSPLLPEMAKADSHFHNALFAVRDMLADEGLMPVPVMSGPSAVALWIAFGDLPRYDRLRLWLHRFCAEMVECHPKLLTLEPNSRGGSRAHLHVETNAPGRYSILPYSLRLQEGYPLALPVPWSAIADFEYGSVRIGDLNAWIEEHGEMLSVEHAIGKIQHFSDLELADLGLQSRSTPAMYPDAMPAQKVRGPMINVFRKVWLRKAFMAELPSRRALDLKASAANARSGALYDASAPKIEGIT